MMIPASIGEVLDKISILEIKSERMSDEGKLANVRKELDALRVASEGHRFPDIEAELKAVNEALWEIEDRLRVKEKLGEFDDEFIRLARAVYITNDKRAGLKRSINSVSMSDLTEEKSYS